MRCPMPLKHATETRLVILLGGVLAGVGVLMRVLPPFPQAAFLLGGLWLLSLLYPLLLLPLFRARRADYTFRMLHFLPSALLLVWAAAPSLSDSGATMSLLLVWYTWEQGLPPLAVSFLLLFLYCFRVVRQRVVRSVVLSGIFLLFAVSLVYGRWSWDFFRDLPASFTEAPSDDGVLSVNTDPSSSLGEEVWRMRLRRMHRRQGRLGREDGLVDRPSLPPNGVPIFMSASSSSVPPKLVSSGISFEWSVFFFLALYTGILHVRARRRAHSF